MAEPPLWLAEWDTEALGRWLAASDRPVALWPVGSTEPHGPHLPLSTDVLLAEENALRAARALCAVGVPAVVVPALPFGVTDFAAGFPGALSVPADALVEILCAVAAGLLRDGFAHVGLINHHLEPGHLRAVERARAAIAATHGEAAVSAPSVISRRWGGQLGDEFKSGACHAGAYETSLALAADARRVDQPAAAALPALQISLSAAIDRGAGGFKAIGMERAYTGAPAAATRAEGERLYAVLTEMVVQAVVEARG